MKEMLWLVLAILIIFLLILFIPRGAEDQEEYSEQASMEISVGTENEQGETHKSVQPEIDEEARYQSMQDEFAKLVKARRMLERRLAKLKYHLRDVKLPPEQVGAINEYMLNGYKLLRTPKMLGAFSGIADINAELGRVNYAYANLDEVDRILDQYKSKENAINSTQE
jgi:hypothetical protein